jgi:hypothetical protein
MSYEPRLPDYATMRRTMGRLSVGAGAGAIPCPNANCRGTLVVADGEMACDACASTKAPFPSTDRSN